MVDWAYRLMHRWAFFLLLAVVPSVCLAQTSGLITGIVRDASGAPAADVKLTVEQTPTARKREARTDKDGRYVVPNLPSGTYRIRAEKTGFRTLVRAGIELSVAEQATVDMTLEVGALEQAITVNAQGSQVNTQSSELSYLVGERAMEQLPLNGRNYTDLAFLQPAVLPFPNRDGGSVVAHGLAMSVNGQDPRSNIYMLDGSPLNDFTNGPAGSAASTVLGLESIREFRVEVNAYSAEFGRSSGGQLNALSKSGGNAVHGSAYYFNRNDHLDARNFFDAEAKPEFRRNQYGGSIGGPIRKEKTFYFAGYEALRETLGKTVNTLTPDENARKGTLPDGPVLINPSVVPYLNEMPLPNGPSRGGGLAAYYFPFKQTLTDYFGQGRIDHYFTPNQQSFVRYTIDDADQFLPTDFPQFPRAFLSTNQFVTLDHNWIQSAVTTHSFRGSFSRTQIGQSVDANTSQPLQPFIPGRSIMGDIDIGGMPRFGPQSSVNVQLTQNVYGFEYGYTHLRGRQLLKAGTLAERYQDNMVNPTFSLGIHTFNDLRSFLTGRPARFLGLPPGGQFDRYWRFTLMGFYLQDEIRLNPRLTLNFGARYEFSTMPQDIYNRDSALPNLMDTAPTVGPLYQNPTYKNFSPRGGFAWNVFGDGKLALRGGYGLYWNTNNQQHLIVTVTNPPATPRVSVNNSTFPVPDLSAAVANTIRPIQYDIQSPRIQVYNLTLDRQLPWNSLLSVGYAGSRGMKLWRNGDWNTAIPTQLPDGAWLYPAGAPRRRNPAFGVMELKTSDGNSWYNALVVNATKRFSNGVSIQSAYTHSRNIDTTQASTFFSDSTSGTTSAMPELPGFNYNKGLADYHAKNNWVTNFIWMLPKGFQFSGIFTMRSGNPLTLFVQRNRSRSLWQPSMAPGQGFDRPSMAPGRTYENAVLGLPNQWFDPTAFILQPAGTLGTMGRGALIGPDLRSLDLAFMKNFILSKVSESANVQFRVESFNLLNRANFGPPALTAFAGDRDGETPLSSLGLVRNTVTSARQIQLGVRFVF